MSFVIGRGEDRVGSAPAGELGTYRALDGSDGAPLYLDFDSPHAVFVVGKRGYGKSYTTGVIAEELARTSAVAPVLVDPMGAFDTVAGTDLPATVHDQPTVTPGSVDPPSWCALVGLDTQCGAGALVWQAAQDGQTLEEMRSSVRASDADRASRRAALNHLDMADRWEVFDADSGLDAAELSGPELTVLDLSGLADAPMNAVVRGVAESLYRARVAGTVDRLPWLLVDEAHTFFDGVAAPAIETLLTRGRAPGVSTVLVTQRPSAVPGVAVSQSDILVSHRLTARSDVEALAAAQPTYMSGALSEKLPTETGAVLVVDDATETVHAARIRERDTPHGGDSATVSGVSLGPEGDEIHPP